MRPILVSSGEPAGIGPDICLKLAKYQLPIVVLGDKKMLEERRDQLNLNVFLREFHADAKSASLNSSENTLLVSSVSTASPVKPGQLDVKNASYVVELLKTGAERCMQGVFSALVTAPVHKGIINQAEIPFTGHTEFFANYFGIQTVVMMLASDVMRVALATTHLPLQKVPAAITPTLLKQVIAQLHQSLSQDFGLSSPKIWVAGLNPHAGEGGYLGREEIEVIIPTLQQLKGEGIDVQGPFPADTLFNKSHIKEADVFLAMYHDQGLPVLKYASFGQAVNITLGLPIIRTSVDHGTACDLAGTGKAEEASLVAAIKKAQEMVEVRSLWQKSA